MDESAIDNKWSKMAITDNIILLSTIFMIVSLLLPAFNVSIPQTLRIGLNLSMISGFYLCIFIKSSRLAIRVILFTILIILFNLLIYYLKWSSYIDVFTKSYGLFFVWYPLIQSFYYVNVKNDKRLGLVVKIILFFSIITCITTILGLNKFPTAARDLASPIVIISNTMYSFYNIGGYDFIYFLVLLIPSVLYIFKNTKNVYIRILLLIVLLLCFTCIIKSQYTIALILSFLLVIPFLLKSLNTVNIIIFILIDLLILLVLKNKIISLFLLFSNIYRDAGIETLSVRFREIYYSLTNNELVGGALNRGILYRQSFNSFLKSPVTGNLFLYIKNPLGGHSEILDILGGAGIFGLSVFSSILLIYRKYILKNLNQISTYILFAYLILGSVNTIFSSPLIGIAVFLLPCCLKLMDNKNIEEKI